MWLFRKNKPSESPESVLPTLRRASSEDELHSAPLPKGVAAILLERPGLRDVFAFSALARHIDKLRREKKLPDGVDALAPDLAVLDADMVANIAKGVHGEIEKAAAHCLKDLIRLRREGYGTLLLMHFRKTRFLHLNTDKEAVVCNLADAPLTIPCQEDVQKGRMKRGARSFDMKTMDMLRFPGEDRRDREPLWHQHQVMTLPALSIEGHK